MGTLALQWLDYQRLVRSNAGLMWDGLLATGFLALGIWLGARLLAKRPPPIEGEGNPQAQAALGISAVANGNASVTSSGTVTTAGAGAGAETGASSADSFGESALSGLGSM